VATHLPVLMLLRQNGREEDGWRGSAFYCPVLLTPMDTKTAMFANEVRPDTDDQSEENNAA